MINQKYIKYLITNEDETKFMELDEHYSGDAFDFYSFETKEQAESFLGQPWRKNIGFTKVIPVEITVSKIENDITN